MGPIRDQLESDVGLRRALDQRMAKRGFSALMVPQDQGGAGLDAMSFVLALGAIARVVVFPSPAGMNVTFNLNLSQWVLSTFIFI